MLLSGDLEKPCNHQVVGLIPNNAISISGCEPRGKNAAMLTGWEGLNTLPPVNHSDTRQQYTVDIAISSGVLSRAA